MLYVYTSLLRVAYEDHQHQSEKVVVLMHGWPDSPRTWAGVVPGLVAAGYRVIVPALRGFSPTTFLHAETPRTGQLAALGRDLIEFVAALGLDDPYCWDMTGGRGRWLTPAAWPPGSRRT